MCDIWFGPMNPNAWMRFDSGPRVIKQECTNKEQIHNKKRIIRDRDYILAKTCRDINDFWSNCHNFFSECFHSLMGMAVESKKSFFSLTFGYIMLKCIWQRLKEKQAGNRTNLASSWQLKVASEKDSVVHWWSVEITYLPAKQHTFGTRLILIYSKSMLLQLKL